MTQPILFFLVLATVCLNTIAQILLKLGAGQSLLNPYLLGGVITYGVSTLFYISILGRLNLSFIYPTIIGFTIVATTLSGVFWLGEKASLGQWTGTSFIVGGLIIIISSKI